MPGFLYFIETDRQNVSTADLPGWGLAYLLDAGDSLASVQDTDGPKRERGGVLFWAPQQHAGKRVTLDREAQHWQRMPPVEGRPTVWLGWWRDEPPAPEGLLRADGPRHFEVKDAKGRGWLLPLVRAVENGEIESRLPRLWTIDEQGELVAGEAIDKHLWLWEATAPHWAELVATYDGRAIEGEASEHDCPYAKHGETTPKRSIEMLAPILAANYRASGVEAAAMGAFGPRLTHPTTWVQLAHGLMDWMVWSDSQKKAGDPSRSGTGGALTSAGAAA